MNEYGSETLKEKASQFVENTTDTLKDSLKTFGDNVKTVADEVKTVGLEAKDSLVKETSNATQKAKEQSKGILHELKGQVASQVNHFATAFDKTQNHFEAEELSQLSTYSGHVSKNIKGVAEYLEAKDISEMTHDLANLGRRQPAFFLAGAFILGLATSRFLTSTTAKK